jgi:tyrosinase
VVFIGDSPFKDIPSKLLREYCVCVVRGIEESWRRIAFTDNVQRVIDFGLIIDEFMNPIHGGGHGVVAGEMPLRGCLIYGLMSIDILFSS